MCGEADYLTEYQIDLKVAQRYQRRFTPRQIVELHQAGIGPDEANVCEGSSLEIIARRVGDQAA